MHRFEKENRTGGPSRKRVIQARVALTVVLSSFSIHLVQSESELHRASRPVLTLARCSGFEPLDKAEMARPSRLKMAVLVQSDR